MRIYATIAALLLICGCDDSSDDSETTGAATEGATETSGVTGDASASSTSSDDSAGSGTSTTDASSTTADPSGASTTDSGDSAGATGDESGSTGGSTGGSEAGFHPEFVWFADFVREKCVACHNMGQNGNLLLPSVDMTNDEVRLALDSGVATSGRLFIEPFDPAESQAYIMITNDAGEQFPPETTDRVAAWINLGAPYFAE